MRPLCIFLPKICVYTKDFDEVKYISFLIRDDELLERYNENSNKENFEEKNFDEEN